jgi:isoleucyl-tRNA synthetase
VAGRPITNQARGPGEAVQKRDGITIGRGVGELTPALKREGLVRDLVRKLQVARKDAGLSVSQRIELGLVTDSGELQEAIREHREYIMEELLAVRLEHAPLADARGTTDFSIEGHQVQATMRW